MKFSVLVCLWLVFFPENLRAANDTLLEKQVDNLINEVMKEKKIPGLSVLVLKRGEKVFAKGYGLESIEYEIPSKVETSYPISSVSRILTATLVMRLVDAKKLSITDRVSDYIDYWPADKKEISIKHLLNHTHGLQDFYGSTEFGSLKNAPSEQVLKWSVKQRSKFKPGSKFDYGVIGYVVVAELIQNITGMTFIEAMDSYVLKPLLMDRVKYGGTEEVLKGVRPLLYEWKGNQLKNKNIQFKELVYPAGGANASVEDLGKLVLGVLDTSFLSEKSKKVMWTENLLPSGKSTYYSLGWYSYINKEGQRIIGAEGGGASWLLYLPGSDLFVVALSNMSMARADSLPYEISKIFIDK